MITWVCCSAFIHGPFVAVVNRGVLYLIVTILNCQISSSCAGLCNSHDSSPTSSISACIFRRPTACLPAVFRPARNGCPEFNLPCILSPEQATLVLQRDLAEVFYGHPSGKKGKEPSVLCHEKELSCHVSSNKACRIQRGICPIISISGTSLARRLAVA